MSITESAYLRQLLNSNLHAFSRDLNQGFVLGDALLPQAMIAGLGGVIHAPLVGGQHAAQLGLRRQASSWPELPPAIQIILLQIWSLLSALSCLCCSFLCPVLLVFFLSLVYIVKQSPTSWRPFLVFVNLM